MHIPKSKITNLFASKLTALRTCVQIFLWMATALYMFGIVFTADTLGGSLYRNFILMCLAGIPALISSVYMTSKFGRKIATLLPLSLAG